MRSAAVALCGVLAVAACGNGAASSGAGTSAGSVSATPPAASSASPVASSAAPATSVAYVAVVAVTAASAPQPEKTGGLGEWARDRGKTAVGEQRLSLTIGGGRAEGTAEGVLGPQTVTGVADEHGIALELTAAPAAPSAMFSGVGTVASAEGALIGVVRWSRGDGLVAREGRVALKPR